MVDADVISNLELLFDRPHESMITPKGEEKVLFKLNQQLVPSGYENNALDLNNRFGSDASRDVPLQQLDRDPKFTKARQLPHDAEFSLFIPAHKEMATEVIDELMAVPENKLDTEFISTGAFYRININPQLFSYCYSVALLHRRDTRPVQIANHAEIFPSKFMYSKVFQQARESTAVLNASERTPIIIPRDTTATDLDEEHRLAYFREDVGVNLHHWHWHLVYPFSATNRALVDKDRRGELFFYMHQQIIARYNNERLNNALPRVKKFSNWREPIPEAYFPKLDSLTTSRGWPPRQAGMTWQDLNRPVDNLNITVADMMNIRSRIEEAISNGFVKLPNGSTQPLNIDMLGNMVEASILSPNPDYYGTLHNNGHLFCAYMHDPQHRYLETSSVFADAATTMRDPLFYRWHAFIDELFQSHKESPYVSPYSRSELENPGVQVQSVSIENLEGGGANDTLYTFWMLSDVDLSKGLDFSERGAVYARFTHLNHRPFRYVINVNNTGSARQTTVRIFIAPTIDEGNRPWVLTDQRKMFIEMDRFVVPLNAGQNTITRRSIESSVTIPFEQTFRDLSRQGADAKRDDVASFNFCGCGWPQHMLVPKGTVAGAQYQLFVMLSNYELDRVDQPDGSELPCDQASSFCGIKDKLYPDKRAMGFPFDRPSSTASIIEDFILGNMALKNITIRLSDTTETNPRNLNK